VVSHPNRSDWQPLSNLPGVSVREMLNVATSVIPFISHRTQLRLREARRVTRFIDRYGHYVRPTPAQEQTLSREAVEEGRRDADWHQRHGPVVQGASVLRLAPDSVHHSQRNDVAR
jgi:hypothetical protein